MKISLMGSCLIYILTVTAQVSIDGVIEVPLWPDGVSDGAIVHEGEEEITNRSIEQNAQGLNRAIATVSVPTLTVYPAPEVSATGVAVIIHPGGGYKHLAIDKEGHDVAKRLNAAGITAIVLKYRTWPANVPRGVPEADEVDAAILSDGQQAVKLVRGQAETWELNPNRIGILGFSAGGHLAAMVAAHSKLKQETSRPDFVGLIYPAVPHNIESHIDAQTPPMFIVNAGDDKTTPADGSLRLYQALRAANVPAELHIYATGGHGFGLGVRGGAVTSWPARFVDWLRNLELVFVDTAPKQEKTKKAEEHNNDTEHILAIIDKLELSANKAEPSISEKYLFLDDKRFTEIEDFIPEPFGADVLKEIHDWVRENGKPGDNIKFIKRKVYFLSPTTAYATSIQELNFEKPGKSRVTFIFLKKNNHWGVIHAHYSTMPIGSEDSETPPISDDELHDRRPLDNTSKMPENGQRKRLLEGVPKLLWGGLGTYTDDLMVSSTLRLCLDYIGEKYSKTFLAGTSGAAFDIGWARSTLHAGAGGAIFAHPNHFEEGIDNLFKVIGRQYTIVYKSEPQRLWDVAVQSIDAGRPVIATEWKIDHFAVIAGYDTDKRVFLSRRYSSGNEAPNEYVPLKPEAVVYILAIGEKTEKISPYEAALGAIRFAVASAGTGKNTKARGQGGTSHGMVYGPEAYTEHARIIPEQLNPALDSYSLREHFLFWRLDALSLARAYAVLYLQEIVGQLPASKRKHIHDAVEKYCELLGMIATINIGDTYPIQLGNCDISTSFPYVNIFPANPEELGSALLWCDGEKEIPINKILATPEGRQQFADWLKNLRELEEKAINALSSVVD